MDTQQWCHLLDLFQHTSVPGEPWPWLCWFQVYLVLLILTSSPFPITGESCDRNQPLTEFFVQILSWFHSSGPSWSCSLANIPITASNLESMGTVTRKNSSCLLPLCWSSIWFCLHSKGYLYQHTSCHLHVVRKNHNLFQSISWWEFWSGFWLEKFVLFCCYLQSYVCNFIFYLS